jgi:hypothetical protein
LKPSILYENGGHVTLSVKGAVIFIIDGSGPLPKVEVVNTMVVLIDDGWLGGGTPPVVIVIEGV